MIIMIIMLLVLIMLLLLLLLLLMMMMMMMMIMRWWSPLSSSSLSSIIIIINIIIIIIIMVPNVTGNVTGGSWKACWLYDFFYSPFNIFWKYMINYLYLYVRFWPLHRLAHRGSSKEPSQFNTIAAGWFTKLHFVSKVKTMSYTAFKQRDYNIIIVSKCRFIVMIIILLLCVFAWCILKFVMVMSWEKYPS